MSAAAMKHLSDALDRQGPELLATLDQIEAASTKGERGDLCAKLRADLSNYRLTAAALAETAGMPSDTTAAAAVVAAVVPTEAPVAGTLGTQPAAKGGVRIAASAPRGE